MEFGVFYQLPSAVDQTPAAGIQDTIAQCQLADELGFDAAWLAELHFNARFAVMPSPLLAAEARPTAIEPSASDCATLPMAMASVPVAAAPPPVLLTIRYCDPPPARPAMAEFNWPMVATSLLSIPLATLVIRRCRSSLPTETVFSAWAQELLPKATDPS